MAEVRDAGCSTTPAPATVGASDDGRHPIKGPGWWRQWRQRRIDRVKRIWAQEVQVDVAGLQVRLNAIRAGNKLEPRDVAIAEGVQGRIDAACAATRRRDPIPGRISNWWHGTLVEASFQNLHAAEGLIVPLLSSEAVKAEIPEAVARVEATLERDDPRRLSALDLLETMVANPTWTGFSDASMSLSECRERLRKLVEVGFSAGDEEHRRLRSFRNALVGGAVVLTFVLLGFIGFVTRDPSAVSFCFTPQPGKVACPSGGTQPRWEDVVVIALLGMLGGLLSGIVSIRNMQGTSIAYDVPQALAWLKLPLGALSAIGGLLVVRGQFVPGLTNLDSSDQILAYAFSFGVAQQLVVGLVDKQAQALLSGAPGKASAVPRPERIPAQTPVGSPRRHASPDQQAASEAPGAGGERERGTMIAPPRRDPNADRGAVTPVGPKTGNRAQRTIRELLARLHRAFRELWPSRGESSRG